MVFLLNNRFSKKNIYVCESRYYCVRVQICNGLNLWEMNRPEQQAFESTCIRIYSFYVELEHSNLVDNFYISDDTIISKNLRSLRICHFSHYVLDLHTFVLFLHNLFFSWKITWGCCKNFFPLITKNRTLISYSSISMFPVVIWIRNVFEMISPSCLWKCKIQWNLHLSVDFFGLAFTVIVVHVTGWSKNVPPSASFYCFNKVIKYAHIEYYMKFSLLSHEYKHQDV